MRRDRPDRERHAPAQPKELVGGVALSLDTLVSELLTQHSVCVLLSERSQRHPMRSWGDEQLGQFAS